jgi:hypothetical protein
MRVPSTRHDVPGQAAYYGRAAELILHQVIEPTGLLEQTELNVPEFDFALVIPKCARRIRRAAEDLWRRAADRLWRRKS